MRQTACEANKGRRRVLACAKKALVVLIMLVALLLSPFLLPVRAVVRWIQRGARTEQVTRRRETRTIEGATLRLEDDSGE
ncbi:MAG: hypothetical protein AB1551_08120 [Actinomycetota bacterium]